MKLEMMGLGKISRNMCRRLLRDQNTVYAYDGSTDTLRQAVAAGTTPLGKPEDIQQLAALRQEFRGHARGCAENPS